MVERLRVLPGRERLRTLRYWPTSHACCGFVIALATIVFATAGMAYITDRQLTLFGLYDVQSHYPGLFVLDLMPFVFALWGQYVGMALARAEHPTAADGSGRASPAGTASVDGTSRADQRDDLTGLANGAHFQDSLRVEVASAQRRRTRLGILVIDLDGFSEVNEKYGAVNGDRVLACFAQRLALAIPKPRLLARLGSDCFAILVSPLHSPEHLVDMAHQIGQSIAPACALDDCVLNLGASIGGAIYPDHAHGSYSLLTAARSAMHTAKVYGGGFEMAPAQRRLRDANIYSLSAEMRSAIDDDQLVLHFQPIVDAGARRVHGVEALVRWEHPRRGLVMPDSFMPRVERCGLMQDLSAWVLERALRTTADLRRAGWPLQMSVNLSALSLLDSTFPDFLADRLSCFDLPGQALTLEVTEDTLMSDQQRTLDTIARVTDLGVGISIDDFGTGYSQLAYLKRLAASELKIDRSFVQDILFSHTDLSIVQATIDLAHALDLRVVGEGIEEEAQAERLRLLGCDLLQGFSMPVPCRLPAWLGGWRSGVAVTLPPVARTGSYLSPVPPESRTGGNTPAFRSGSGCTHADRRIAGIAPL